MRPLFPLLLAVAAVLPACATARRTEYVTQCDTAIVARASAPEVADRVIEQLFETADEEECSDNKEFMKKLNVALFNVLERQPRSFLHYFSAAHNRSFILGEIENPISDSINITRIVSELQQITPTNQATYDALMNALRSATTNRDPDPPPE